MVVLAGDRLADVVQRVLAGTPAHRDTFHLQGFVARALDFDDGVLLGGIFTSGIIQEPVAADLEAGAKTPRVLRQLLGQVFGVSNALEEGTSLAARSAPLVVECVGPSMLDKPLQNLPRFSSYLGASTSH